MSNRAYPWSCKGLDDFNNDFMSFTPFGCLRTTSVKSYSISELVSPAEKWGAYTMFSEVSLSTNILSIYGYRLLISMVIISQVFSCFLYTYTLISQFIIQYFGQSYSSFWVHFIICEAYLWLKYQNYAFENTYMFIS